MFICIYNNKFLAVTAIVAVALSLASCERVDSTPKTDAGFSGTQAAEQATIPVPDDAFSADGTLSTPIERRHFAIYSNYQVLFDDSREAFVPGIDLREEGGQPAAVAASGALAGNIPACSMRDLLMQD